MLHSDYPIAILFGPTASGKTDIALSIAQRHRVGIINADSKQIFKEIPILTAQPTLKEQSACPHYLFGDVSILEYVSVAYWVKRVVPAIHKCWEQGRLPLLVGGTGMYLNALVKGMSPVPEADRELRADIQRMHQTLGNEAMHKLLLEKDPLMAERLSTGDTQRVLRAYEVVLQTGISLAAWQEKPLEKPLPHATIKTFFVNKNREEVYEHCNQRFDQMLEAGVLEEARAVDSLSPDTSLPAMRAHGLPELLSYLHGQTPLDRAAELAKRNTRHYIKRQYTWFRHQMPDSIRLEGNNHQEIVRQALSNVSSAIGSA